jgi:hypothetical protein
LGEFSVEYDKVNILNIFSHDDLVAVSDVYFFDLHVGKFKNGIHGGK